MARTELSSIIQFTRQIVSDTAESTWSSSANIIDALDAHSVFIDWTPLRHDTDYHTYEAKARDERHLRAVSANVQDRPSAFSMPDFGTFYRVGYFDTNWIIRNSPSEAGQAQSPSASNAIRASWSFSTAVNQELYLQGTAHNPWLAAADLLMETPSTGREFDTQRTRGQVSRSMEQKFGIYAKRGHFLNRRRPDWQRS